MVSLEVIAILLSGISISASLFYYANIIRNANKARQRELIYQKYQNYSLEYARAFHEVQMMNDWVTVEEFEEKYGRENNLEANSKWLYVMRLYNLAGLYLKEGADPDLIFELYPAVAILNLWELFEPVIIDRRDRVNDPNRLGPLEHLYTEAKKRYPDIITRNR